MPLPASAFPLRTSGPEILGADGSAVRLAGVNWGGGEQDECVPYGLDKLHRSEIISRIAGWGLNHVRLPFAVAGFVNADSTPRTAPAPLARTSANPDLQGLTPWGIYQVLVNDLTEARLYVVADQHMITAGWCCSGADGNGLWYATYWPPTAFISAWKLVATRFAANPRVGYDIHNEPRATTVSGKTVTPTWGDGNGWTDFRHMYADMAGRIRAIDPDCLIFCEGLNYASDLTGWKAHPVTGPGIVASVHDYSWFHPAGQSVTDYYAQMDANAGYLVQQGTVPLWVGEFGADTDAADAARTAGWLPQFISWAAARGVHWCWWELNATGVKGTEPVTNTPKVAAGARESFGLISGYDWLGSQVNILGQLAPIMPAP
jgi:endoglucanase